MVRIRALWSPSLIPSPERNDVWLTNVTPESKIQETFTAGAILQPAQWTTLPGHPFIFFHATYAHLLQPVLEVFGCRPDVR